MILRLCNDADAVLSSKLLCTGAINCALADPHNSQQNEELLSMIESIFRNVSVNTIAQIPFFTLCALRDNSKNVYNCKNMKVLGIEDCSGDDFIDSMLRIERRDMQADYKHIMMYSSEIFGHELTHMQLLDKLGIIHNLID